MCSSVREKLDLFFPTWDITLFSTECRTVLPKHNCFFNEVYANVSKFKRQICLFQLCFFFLFLFLRRSFALVTQAGVQWRDGSQLTATSTSRVQAILLPQPPE